MRRKWNFFEIIGVIGVVATLFGCLANYMVVPWFQPFFEGILGALAPARAPTPAFVDRGADVPCGAPPATPIPAAEGGRNGPGLTAPEWWSDGYVLLDYARIVEVRAVFHPVSSPADIETDFTLVTSSGESAPMSVRVASYDPTRRRHGVVRAASQVEHVEPGAALLAIISFNTPGDCLAAGNNNVDSCMAAKALCLRWVQFNLTEELALQGHWD